MSSALRKNKTPWGYWEVLLKGDGYKVKRLTVEVKKRISLQRHDRRKECWTVVGGVGVVTIGNAGGVLYEYRVAAGDVVKIAPCIIHRIENIAEVPLMVIEVQTGDCDEKDIVRLHDDYGRK